MAGTLILNSISPDVGTNLYLNATQGAGNVVIGNTTTALATFTNAGTLIVSNVVSNLVGNVIGNIANTNITGLIIATQGGTGLTSPGTTGNVLTSNGSTWISSALPAAGVTSLNGATGAITNTGSGDIGSYVGGFLNSASASISRGSTTAGSNIYIVTGSSAGSFYSTFYLNYPNNYYSTTNPFSGTWRAMTTSRNGDANCCGNFKYSTNLFVRIS